MTTNESLQKDLAEAVLSLANSVVPLGISAGKDATGGTVHSLTEAVMGITAGLCRIADAIDRLADEIAKAED